VHSIPNLGWPQALDLLQRKVVDPDDYILHVYPFAQVPEAVQFAARARSETVRVMVDFRASGQDSSQDPGPGTGQDSQNYQDSQDKNVGKSCQSC
jgi:hypothetical protein